MHSITEALMLKVLYEAIPTGLTSAELRGKLALPDVTYEQVRQSLRARGYIDEIRPTDRWCILEPGKAAWQSLRPLLNEEIVQNANVLVSQADEYVSKARQTIEELQGNLNQSREELQDNLNRSREELTKCDNRHKRFAIVAGLFAACLAELILIWFWEWEVFASINRHHNMIPIHISIMIFIGFMIAPLVYKPWLNFSVVVGIAALFPGIYVLFFT